MHVADARSVIITFDNDQQRQENKYLDKFVKCAMLYTFSIRYLCGGAARGGRQVYKMSLGAKNNKPL